MPPKGEHLWKPGCKSPNPGGLSSAEIAARKLVARSLIERTNGGQDIVDLLLRVAMGEEPGMRGERSRCFAIREILDRMVGRAPLDVELALASREATPEQLAVLEALKLSPFARRQRIAELKSQATDAALPEDSPVVIDVPADPVH